MSDASEDKTMPLLEHLIELRQRLIWSGIAFVIAFGICYYFSNDIYEFLLEPYSKAALAKGGNRRLIYTAPTEAFFTFMKLEVLGVTPEMAPEITENGTEQSSNRPADKREAIQTPFPIAAGVRHR